MSHLLMLILWWPDKRTEKLIENEGKKLLNELLLVLLWLFVFKSSWCTFCRVGNVVWYFGHHVAKYTTSHPEREG